MQCKIIIGEQYRFKARDLLLLLFYITCFNILSKSLYLLGYYNSADKKKKIRLLQLLAVALEAIENKEYI